MEPDRFQQNGRLFIIGGFSLLLSLCLLVFGLFILPFLLWNVHYDVPEFISFWREGLKQNYDFGHLAASWIVFFIFIVPAAILGYVSYWVSNHIDNEIYGIKPDEQEVKDIEATKKKTQESVGYGLKLFLLMLLAVVALFFLQWLISSF